MSTDKLNHNTRTLSSLFFVKSAFLKLFINLYNCVIKYLIMQFFSSSIKVILHGQDDQGAQCTIYDLHPITNDWINIF